MNKLLLVQHITNNAMVYHGFTIKPGMYYGVVKTPFGNIPAAWSGWTSGTEIALYTLLNGVWSMHFINEEDVPLWHISLDTEEWDEIPFFCVA